MLLFLWGLNGLFNSARCTHSYGVLWDIFGDDGTSPDGRALADANTGKDDHIATDPAIILNENRMAKFHELLARKNTGVMSSSENTCSSTNLNPVTNDNKTGI